MFNSKKENIFLKIAAIATYLIMVTCNSLANILPLNGTTTGAVSDSYSNLFAPIGFTFSIWGVIYLLLGVFCIFQFTKFRNKKSKIKESSLVRILPYFIATSILNSVWIFSWHFNQIGLSTIIIILILLSLVKIVSILRTESYKKVDYLAIRLPFSIYLGWITVATIANITTLLVSIGWNGLGLKDSFWTIVILTVGALIALIVSKRNKDIPYLLVIIWAYFGILAKHLSESGFNAQYENVITVLVLLIGAFLYGIYDQLTRR